MVKNAESATIEKSCLAANIIEKSDRSETGIVGIIPKERAVGI